MEQAGDANAIANNALEDFANVVLDNNDAPAVGGANAAANAPVVVEGGANAAPVVVEGGANAVVNVAPAVAEGGANNADRDADEDEDAAAGRNVQPPPQRVFDLRHSQSVHRVHSRSPSVHLGNNLVAAAADNVQPRQQQQQQQQRLAPGILEAGAQMADAQAALAYRRAIDTKWGTRVEVDNTFGTTTLTEASQEVGYSLITLEPIIVNSLNMDLFAQLKDDVLTFRKTSWGRAMREMYARSACMTSAQRERVTKLIKAELAQPVMHSNTDRYNFITLVTRYIALGSSSTYLHRTGKGRGAVSAMADVYTNTSPEALDEAVAIEKVTKSLAFVGAHNAYEEESGGNGSRGNGNRGNGNRGNGYGNGNRGNGNGGNGGNRSQNNFGQQNNNNNNSSSNKNNSSSNNRGNQNTNNNNQGGNRNAQRRDRD